MILFYAKNMEAAGDDLGITQYTGFATRATPRATLGLFRSDACTRGPGRGMGYCSKGA